MDVSPPLAALTRLPKASTAKIFRRFAVIFPAGFLLIFILCYTVAQLEFKRVTATTMQEELGNIELLRFVVRNDLEILASDLLLLANNESLEHYFEEESDENLQALAERFKNFSRDKKIYTQVRYFDVDGHEVVRVNMEKMLPTIVPEGELQDKSKRYYFRKTMEQGWGEVFVSPLDLNIENGEVYQPFSPVIRVGSPVVDRHGHKKGIVLLNCNAEQILDRYSHAFPGKDASRFSFLNKDGYWLRSGNPEDEWGFMFGNKVTLKSRLPQLWEKVRTEDVGQMRLAEGLYTYSTIHAEDEVKRSANFSGDNGLFADHSHGDDKVIWHLILHIPDEELSFSFFIRTYSHLFWLFPLLFCALIAASLYLAIIRANKDINARSLLLLSAGIEQSPAAIVITDTDGTIEYVNPKFAEMSGYDSRDIIGENPRILKSGTTSDDTYKDLWSTLGQGEVWEGSFENKRGDGASYFVFASISPIINKAGVITHFIGIQEDVTEKKRMQEELEKLATTDALTGVSNRSHFMTCFEREVRRTIRYKHAMTVLAFDLDFFKKVNDTYGHHGGDLALIGFTDVVKKELRDSDFLGRLGGEEFSAVLVQTDEAGAVLLAERLRQAVEQLKVTCDDRIIQITVSIGVAEWRADDKDTEDLLKRADRALYAAKNAGRNQVKVSGRESYKV
ncbi:sensor domain-containing diguanylate cyclase [Desulforhopalus sp. 52FAK]